MKQKLNSTLAPHNAALYCEDPEEIAKLVSEFHAEHDPVGPTETYLVEQLARAAWRTRRLGRVELGVLDYETAITAGVLERERLQDRERISAPVYQDNTSLLGKAFYDDCKGGRAQTRVAALQAEAEKAFLRCLKQLLQLQDRRLTRARAKSPEPIAKTAANSTAPVAITRGVQSSGESQIGSRSPVAVSRPTPSAAAPSEPTMCPDPASHPTPQPVLLPDRRAA